MRLLRFLMLPLAVLPTLIVVIVVLRIWATGDNDAWAREIWPVVALQILAIGLFWWHAGSNRKLEAEELQHWIFQFIVYIPYGMVSYWFKHIADA